MNEDNNVEYKRELTNHLKREIVSMLNSNGGVIYLGVDDKTLLPFEVDDAQRHEWEDIVSNCITSAFYPIPYSLIDVLPNEEVFTIKVMSGRSKPYAIAKNGFDSSGVYIREGSHAVRATNERVRRMQQQYRISGEFDSEVSDNQELHFYEIENKFKRLDLEYNLNSLGLKSKGAYNNAALLLSEENPFITKFAIFDGLTVMTFKDKHEFMGSLTTQIDDTLKYISFINRKRIVITGKTAERDEQLDYPVEAIRESLVNAIVHRDYLLHSDVKIEVFDDHMDIMSPGGIPEGLSLDDIKVGYTAARNPRLIHVLDKMNYIENYGTGIRRIFDAYLKTDMEPKFYVGPNSFKVELPNLNYKINNDSELSEEELIILRLFSKSNPIRRIEIEQKTGFSKWTVISILNKLLTSDTIEKIGTAKETTYILK